MTLQRLSNHLLGLAVLLALGAILWSLQSYGAVGQMVAGKGLRPVRSIVCLYSFGEPCNLLSEAAATKGTVAYTPWLFWISIALFVVSVALNLSSGRQGDDGGWGAALQRLLIPVDKISTFFGHTFAWCILALTLAVSYEVFSRYVLGKPTAWAYDASYILYGALFIMAGAYALCRNGHVRGDFLYRSWPPRVQAGVDLVLYFLFFFPAIVAFIYAGYGFAAASWAVHEHSSFSPAGPPIYHFKALIPLTGVLLLLQGIVEVIRCLICLKAGAWPQRLHDVEELEKVILEQHKQQERAPS